MLKLKYENLGKIPSIVGTALHSAQDGDIVQILARWSLLNMKEFTDEYITVVKGQINSMLVEWVYLVFYKCFQRSRFQKIFYCMQCI